MPNLRAERDETAASGPGAAVLIAGIAVSEVATSLLVAVAKRPALGTLCLGAGLAFAFRWLRRRRRFNDGILRGQLAAATRFLAEGNRTAAWNAASAAADADAASASPRRNAALAILAQVALEENRLQAAREILGQVQPRRAVDPWLEARVELADGQQGRAIAILERARRGPSFGAPAARLLVELLAATNDLEQAVRVATEHLDLLDPQDVQNMIASLQAWDEPRHAAALTMAVTMRRIGFRAARELRVSSSPSPSRD
jgi:hypothetical protein